MRDFGKRISLLQATKVTRQRVLTPRARKLYAVGQKMRKLGKKLLLKNYSLQRKLDMAHKFIDNQEFLDDAVNGITRNFIVSQIRLQCKKPKGRRFTTDDKVLALSLYKRGAKTYKFLRNIFALPSRKTLVQLLHRIPITVGISEPVMKSLEEAVQKLRRLDRYAIVMFDEMSLDAGLTYNPRKDFIVGFQDTGDERKTVFADHALVFMAHGIRRRWKQPISYYFSNGGLSSVEIAKNLKVVIRQLEEIGVVVTSTVCDQCSPNCAAINMLIRETRDNLKRNGEWNRISGLFGFCISGREIIPLYDVPHLLKGVRNQLVLHSAKFSWKKARQIASWNHVIRLYESDSQIENYKMFPKLTEKHVIPSKIKKMKVKCAAQVFSQSLSSVMRFLSKDGIRMPRDAEDTSDFLLLFDQLFDSCNGSSVRAKKGKLLRTAIHKNSRHHQFWENILPVLESIRFLTKDDVEKVPPSIKNWIHTVKGCRRLWYELHKDGFNFVCPRNFQQDPLENFFGVLRQQGVRNVNPQCSSFEDSFKTALVNNFLSVHSPGANCEADNSIGALSCLKNFVTRKKSTRHFRNFVTHYTTPTATFEFKTPSVDVIQLHAYIAGYIVKKLMLTVGDCDTCRAELITSERTTIHQLIEAKEYCSSKHLLQSPQHHFVQVFSQMTDVAQFFLPRTCLEKGVSRSLKERIFDFVDNKFSCKEHNIFEQYVHLFSKMYIFHWVKEVNSILKGLLLYDGNDPIKIAATKYFEKMKVRKNSVNKIKQLS